MLDVLSLTLISTMVNVQYLIFTCQFCSSLFVSQNFSSLTRERYLPTRYSSTGRPSDVGFASVNPHVILQGNKIQIDE
jgi:hypothetical protein